MKQWVSKVTMLWRLVWRRRWRWCVAVAVATAVWLRIGPLPAGLLDESAYPSTVVVDRYGERLYEARSATGTRADRLSAEALPPSLVLATLAAEDARFRSHLGVDPLAVARAAWTNFRTGRVGQG